MNRWLWIDEPAARKDQMNFRIHTLLLHPQPVLSIICAFSPDRRYLLDRSWAEMEVELAGLPVQLVAAEQLDGEWNECAGKNVAAGNVETSLLLFTNCDIVIPRDVCEQLGEWTVRFESDSRRHWRWMVHCPRVDEQPDGAWLENHYAMGDFQALPYSLWKQVRFDERLTGWGFLDVDFARRCLNMATDQRILAGFVRHHWHPRLSDEEYRAMNERNRAIAGATA